MAPTTSPVPGFTASGVYEYDARNRLSRWTRSNGIDPAVDRSYGYDSLGNLTGHGGEVQQYDETATGRPHAVSSRAGTSYQYDASGNLAAKLGLEGSVYYGYDSGDRLVCVSSTPAETCNLLAVTYDASGRRVREETATASRWFRGEEYVSTVAEGRTVQRVEVRAFGERVAYVHYERSDTASAAPLRLRGRALPPWAPGLVPLVALLAAGGFALRGGLLLGVARRPGTAGVAGLVSVSLVLAPYPIRGGGRAVQIYHRWVLSDPLGSALTELDADGAVVRQVRYRPFGGLDGEHDLAPAASKRSSYAGHDRQEETGLVYMKARWMDPTTGTFLSVDPVVAAAGDPQSYNGYAYVRNNPVSYSDPSGMYPELPGYYWVNSHVSSDGMSVTNVFTNSAEAAGAAWFGPLDAGSFLGSSPSSSIGGFPGLNSLSMADVGGASLAGFGGLGGAPAASQSASNSNTSTQAVPALGKRATGAIETAATAAGMAAVTVATTGEVLQGAARTQDVGRSIAKTAARKVVPAEVGIQGVRAVNAARSGDAGKATAAVVDAGVAVGLTQVAPGLGIAAGLAYMKVGGAEGIGSGVLGALDNLLNPSHFTSSMGWPGAPPPGAF